jgi:hypothetical protein
LPSAHQDTSALSVHRDDHSPPSDVCNEPGKEGVVYSTVAKCSAADDHFFRTGGENTFRAGCRSDAAAYPHSHGSPAAKLADESRIAAAAHGGVQVDDVKQGIIPKTIQQAENVLNRQPQFAAADQLYRAAVLKINAGYDHVQISAVFGQGSGLQPLAAQPHGHSFRMQKAFEFAKLLHCVVKNGSSQSRIGMSLFEYIQEI